MAENTYTVIQMSNGAQLNAAVESRGIGSFSPSVLASGIPSADAMKMAQRVVSEDPDAVVKVCKDLYITMTETKGIVKALNGEVSDGQFEVQS